MTGGSWGPREDELHPRDKSTGEFIERTSALIVEAKADHAAWQEMADAGRSSMEARYFEDRDRLVAIKMRELLELAEYRAWFNEKLRRQNARDRARLEWEQTERDRLRHRTYRAKRDRWQAPGADDERIRTVNRGGTPVRVRVRSRGEVDRPYRVLTPTRFQPARRPR